LETYTDICSVLFAEYIQQVSLFVMEGTGEEARIYDSCDRYPVFQKLVFPSEGYILPMINVNHESSFTSCRSYASFGKAIV
jgi:hypothetical protein